MSEFETFLRLGFFHISDLEAYDHIVFLIALCAVYKYSQWRNVLILVTAFTIGHSVTLALSTLDIILMPTRIIEFLIPITILATALFNVFEHTEEMSRKKLRQNYVLAMLFGLIHGSGFSNYLKSFFGSEESVLVPLFAFNVGLEIGQILIVLIIMIGSFLALNTFHAKHRDWNLFVSGAASGIAMILIQQTWPW